MPQFIVRVYPVDGRFRVVVDGVTHFDADREEEIEGLAREAILGRLRAFLPLRALPPRDPAVAYTLFFDVELARAPDPTRPAGRRTPRRTSRVGDPSGAGPRVTDNS